MTRREGTRQRMLTSALWLLRERGAHGVTLDAVLAHSGAPRGSIYHHFPGGRDQLLIEAAELGGEVVIEIAERNESPRAALAELVNFWKQLLHDSDYRAGCPTVALAVAGAEHLPEAAELTRQTFERVTNSLVRQLRAVGVPDEPALSMANVAIAALEGAVILCRVQRSTRALEDVAALLDGQLAMLG